MAERTTLDLMLWRRFNGEVQALLEDTLRRNPSVAPFATF